MIHHQWLDEYFESNYLPRSVIPSQLIIQMKGSKETSTIKIAPRRAHAHRSSGCSGLEFLDCSKGCPVMVEPTVHCTSTVHHVVGQEKIKPTEVDLILNVTEIDRLLSTSPLATQRLTPCLSMNFMGRYLGRAVKAWIRTISSGRQHNSKSKCLAI
jgi:hypothetical protein